MTDAPVGSGCRSPCDRCRTSIPQTMLVHRKIRRGTDGYRQHGQVAVPGLCRPAAEQRPRCRGRGAGDPRPRCPGAGSPRLPGGTDLSRRCPALTLAVVAMEAVPPGRAGGVAAELATPESPEFGRAWRGCPGLAASARSPRAASSPRARRRTRQAPVRMARRANPDCAHVGTGNNYRRFPPTAAPRGADASPHP